MSIEPSDNPPPSWLRAAGRRLGALWLTKLVGISAGMTLFFVAYFQLLHHPLRPPFVMPLTVLDRWIGFQPAALPLYLSLWVYVSLAPALIAGRRQLQALAIAALGLSVAGLGIFLVWPTAVPAMPGATWAADSAFAFLKQVDASGNACPSLHVAFAVLAAGAIARSLGEIGAGRLPSVFNGLWCAGILWSTIATRQHVALDVAAGALLGVAVTATYGQWLNRTARRGRARES